MEDYTEIYDNIQEGELLLAIENLLKKIEADSEYRSDLISLKYRLEQLPHQKREGLASFESLSAENNKILHSIFGVVQELDNPDKEKIEKEFNNKNDLEKGNYLSELISNRELEKAVKLLEM